MIYAEMRRLGRDSSRDSVFLEIKIHTLVRMRDTSVIIMNSHCVSIANPVRARSKRLPMINVRKSHFISSSLSFRKAKSQTRR
jgi:hypothetical protein